MKARRALTLRSTNEETARTKLRDSSTSWTLPIHAHSLMIFIRGGLF